MIARMDRNVPRPLPIPALAAALSLLAAGAACTHAQAPQPAPQPTASPTAPAPQTSTHPAPAAPAAAAPDDPTAWTRLLPPPEVPADRPLAAGFLLVDGVYNTELVAPLDVLHHVRFHTEGPGIDVFTVSPDGEPVTSFEGLRIAADHSFASAPPIDVLVVPSSEGSMERDLADAALIDWVRRTGAAARWVVSLCDGSFVLAEAGLLDGLAATTFPADYDRFAQLFPGVDLRVNVSFVHDGPALTSQGGARSFDVAMYLVDHLYGEEVAQGVGRGLLLEWPPDPDRTPGFVVVPRPPADPDAPPALDAAGPVSP
jgi:putative intracellular protease/amidase